MEKIKCLIESDVVELLLCANRNEIPAFVKFIVDDGEQMIIPSDNVHSLKQVYDHYENRNFKTMFNYSILKQNKIHVLLGYK